MWGNTCFSCQQNLMILVIFILNYFSLLGNDITEIEIINVSDDPYLGSKVLVAVMNKVNLYANRCFELATGKVIV